MTSGWPQDQRDLRWPAVDNDDTGATARTRGRVATEPGPGSAKPSGGTDFGSNHPSGPLPVGPMPRTGRLGRGKFRDADPDDAAGDADYDWIRYLGEAGPAQNSGPGASAPTGTAAARPPAVRSTPPVVRPPAGRGTPPAVRPPAVRSTPPAADSPLPPVSRSSADPAVSWPSADPIRPARAAGASGLQARPGGRSPQAEPGSDFWQAERGWPDTSRPSVSSSPRGGSSLDDSLPGAAAARTGPVRSSTPGQHRASGSASRSSGRAARPDGDQAQQPGRAGTDLDNGTGPMPARSASDRGIRPDGKRRAMARP